VQHDNKGHAGAPGYLFKEPLQRGDASGGSSEADDCKVVWDSTEGMPSCPAGSPEVIVMFKPS
jgi:hypothetical protein